MSRDGKWNPLEPDNAEQRGMAPWGTAVAWSLGFTIALPLVVFGILGRFLDNLYETSPFFYSAESSFLSLSLL